MEQIELLRKVVGILEGLEIRYILVGSMASSAYGEPRMTRDIDIVADLHPEQVIPFCSAFPEPEYYVSAHAAMEAVLRRGQFNIIHSLTANKIDVMIHRQGPWEKEQLARARRIRIFEGEECCIAAPEDVIISKMRYYREGGSEKHLRDIVGILKVSSQLIDDDYLEHWSALLGLLEIWRRIQERIAGQ